MYIDNCHLTHFTADPQYQRYGTPFIILFVIVAAVL